MKNKIQPKAKIKVTVKKVLLFSTIVIVGGGILWKSIIGTAAIVVNPLKVSAMFTPATGPQLNGFAWTATITVDHTKVMGSTNLVDFPLLVSLIEPALKSANFGGNVINSNGSDIAFTGGNDMQLDHEIESYDPQTGTLTCWVKIPLLYHDVNTELKIGVGNPNISITTTPESVWNSTYEAVYHMHNNPSNQDLDDAAGNYDGVDYGSMSSSNLVSGVIGKAIKFNGTSNYYAIKNKVNSGSGSIPKLMISSWVKTSFSNESFTSNWSIVDFDRSEFFNFYVHGNGKISFSSTGSNGVNDFNGGQIGQVNDGNWHYVVAVYDGSSKLLYIDGVLVATQANAHNGSGIGRNVTRYGFIGDGSEATTFNGTRNGFYFDGQLDEIRIITIPKSADWIATEYNNQNSPATFYSLGNINNLPIELDYFKANLGDEEVKAEWRVISQRDNDYFTVERSTDAHNFEAIGTVKGAGTTLQTIKYMFIDEQPLEGLSYYRLKQTDYNGMYQDFNIVAINYSKKVESASMTKVYPNPFKDIISVEYELSTSGEVLFSLINQAGIQYYNEKVFAEEGTNSIKFQSLDDLPAGIYMLNLYQNSTFLASKKLIKQ